MTAAAAGVLTMEQRAAAIQMGAVLVLAGAGTGKTKTLTEAVVHRIQVRGIAPSRVLAVTFTNKAAATMAEGIRVALGGTAAPDWIGTFHGLGARQLRAEPEIAGVRPPHILEPSGRSRSGVRRRVRYRRHARGRKRLADRHGQAERPRPTSLPTPCPRTNRHLPSPARCRAVVMALRQINRRRQASPPHGLMSARPLQYLRRWPDAFELTTMALRSRARAVSWTACYRQRNK